MVRFTGDEPDIAWKKIDEGTIHINNGWYMIFDPRMHTTYARYVYHNQVFLYEPGEWEPKSPVSLGQISDFAGCKIVRLYPEGMD